jgi:hypothetical protein
VSGLGRGNRRSTVVAIAAAVTVSPAPLLIVHAGALGAAPAFTLGAVSAVVVVVVTFRFVVRSGVAEPAA